MENTIALDSGRNEPQFLAALQASRNLDIPFQDLKAKMTGSDSMSLGAAIKASKPGMSDSEAKEAANKAERQAKEAKEKISAHANAMADAAAKPAEMTAARTRLFNMTTTLQTYREARSSRDARYPSSAPSPKMVNEPSTREAPLRNLEICAVNGAEGGELSE